MAETLGAGLRPRMPRASIGSSAEQDRLQCAARQRLRVVDSSRATDRGAD
eukprot:CAMPEP_0177489438 /NCGR_PEP_ID=MMETSP0369-20130122/30698_1 /TAXON_ID=447022 ORGANISM="Scrippsiella hangoei-like, Strain SHHI-4" /NCGR_SAMPLE_ID=MMETSP0369 /ASSEMBLY_ACC=CAM_ASM_000364 /LENGTH=49 /DNA_ID= /DNA_START= /DNA_END= /DNA_ORIENTATION=